MSLLTEFILSIAVSWVRAALLLLRSAVVFERELLAPVFFLTFWSVTYRSPGLFWGSGGSHDVPLWECCSPVPLELLDCSIYTVPLEAFRGLV